MKRIRRPLALFLCAILCVLGWPLYGFAAGDRYLVTAAKADLLQTPNEAAPAVGELYAGAYVTAEAESGDFFRVTLASAGITGWVHGRYLTYAGDGDANPQHVKSIYIKTKPDKLIYTEDEETFESEGLSVWAAYTDGSPDRPLSGWRLFAPAFDSAGEKTVVVAYRAAPGTAQFTADFTVTVNKVPLQALAVTSQPKKTAYIERQPLDLAGITLEARYTDGRPNRRFSLSDILADPDFTVSGCHGETQGSPLAVGAHTVGISYKYPDVRCAVAVTAVPRTLTGFSISKMPASTTVYSKTEMPALAGLELTASYDNGETETVPLSDCTVFCDPSRFVLGSGNYVTIAYGGKSVSLDLTYAQDVPVGIRVVPPEILAFVLGEPMDLSALRVEVEYASGRREETDAYEMSAVDAARLGAQTVVVTCGEYSGTFTIYIQEFYRRGDTTGDGAVTAADARQILRAAVGYIHFKGKLFNAADINRDGAITAADARLALRAAVGLEEIG